MEDGTRRRDGCQGLMFHRFTNRTNVPGQALLRRLEAVAYPLFAGFLVIFVARWFIGEMLTQTGGEWSAPLDDVFIHFDFARATARGYPFQWSEGNGYSSGNTSLTYPFILALGYWIGFRGPSLMLWAVIVACCCVFSFLLVATRLARGLPRAARFLIPIVVLSVGALDWALFSGMEVAWFLGVWTVALGYALDHDRCPTHQRAGLGWRLGIAGAFVVATRPEAATSVAVLGFTAGWYVWSQSHRVRPTLATIARAGSPGIALLITQGVINRILTGDVAAAGALVKLAFYNPYMTPQDKWDTYLFHLRYAILRNIDHHFADVPVVGWIPVALAVVALLSPRTRKSAIILVSSAASFMLLVAMNGQVRWQNERYTMPAVAWLLLASALGLGVLLFRRRSTLPRITWIPRGAIAMAAIVLFAIHQAPKMRDQIWFFGRASRNIRDQHTTVGRLLRTALRPPPRRVLVGDAGAIMYASDLPGLDIIGLGGFHGLPIARSSVHGIGATVELLERIPPNELPDVFALYPTWWGKFPIWFGRHITSVWVEGNVICGGAEKAIYAANWRLLNTGARPVTLQSGEVIVDALDVADIVDERRHDYVFPHPQGGYVDMRVLADPITETRDVLDSGRRITDGRTERFTLRSNLQAPSMRLVVRAAPAFAGRVEVTMDDRSIGDLVLEPSDRWRELSLPLPAPLDPGQDVLFTFTPRGVSSWVNYHVWLIASP
jgi:hypothetical protein